MSLFNSLDISGSGMRAQGFRLNITASNLANAETISSSINETYKAREPVFEAMYDEFRENPNSVGVKMKAVVESDAPLRQEYRPNHPMANEDGYVFLPNVNVIEEMANMISAQRSYQSNAEVFTASKNMLMRTLQLGQ
jgi:flagellar basal-body rod protein FlgC